MGSLAQMLGVGTQEVQELVQSAITAVSILGGSMAYVSGYSAAWALKEGCDSQSLAHEINVGLGKGFVAGMPPAALVAMLEIWI